MALRWLSSIMVGSIMLVGCEAQQASTVRAVAIEPSIEMKRVGERLVYRPPVAGTTNAVPDAVAADYTVVWDQTVDILGTFGFEFTELDEREGLILARYKGPPGDFVDCGTIDIETLRRTNARQVAASATPLVIGRDQGGLVRTYERELLLDSRLALRLTPSDDATSIELKTTYVLTKTVERYSSPATSTRIGQESVFFDSFGQGQFEKGTVCRPTGTLERLVTVAAAGA